MDSHKSTIIFSECCYINFSIYRAHSALIPKEYVLKTADEDLKRGITGKELPESLIPRIKKLFNK